jgi:hypothetical protein
MTEVIQMRAGLGVLILKFYIMSPIDAQCYFPFNFLATVVDRGNGILKLGPETVNAHPPPPCPLSTVSPPPPKKIALVTGPTLGLG